MLSISKIDKLFILMSLPIKIKPLILIGSQGSGRDAIAFHLLTNFPHKFQRVISHTTRKAK